MKKLFWIILAVMSACVSAYALDVFDVDIHADMDKVLNDLELSGYTLDSISGNSLYMHKVDGENTYQLAYGKSDNDSITLGVMAYSPNPYQQDFLANKWILRACQLGAPDDMAIYDTRVSGDSTMNKILTDSQTPWGPVRVLFYWKLEDRGIWVFQYNDQPYRTFLKIAYPPYIYNK